MTALRITAAMVIALALAGCADASSFYGVEPVPPAYAHLEPKVPVIVLPIALDHVNTVCHDIFSDQGAYGVDGCTMLGKLTCLVVIPIADPSLGYGADHIAAILEHEKYGHCNDLIHMANGKGWRVAE